MPVSPAAVDLDGASAAPARRPTRALESVPDPARAAVSAPLRGERPPEGCVTVAVERDGICVVRLRGSLGRDAVARVDVVLDAVAPMPSPIVIDLSAARTDERRLWRILVDVVARRRDAGLDVVLEGVHPDVVPDLEVASLPETFLVFRAVCSPSA